jgi:hypothetical protein
MDEQAERLRYILQILGNRMEEKPEYKTTYSIRHVSHYINSNQYDLIYTKYFLLHAFIHSPLKYINLKKNKAYWSYYYTDQ